MPCLFAGALNSSQSTRICISSIYVFPTLSPSASTTATAAVCVGSSRRCFRQGASSQCVAFSANSKRIYLAAIGAETGRVLNQALKAITHSAMLSLLWLSLLPAWSDSRLTTPDSLACGIRNVIKKIVSPFANCTFGLAHRNMAYWSPDRRQTKHFKHN